MPKTLKLSLGVLIGGASRRMGIPKHLLQDDRGRTLLENQLEKLSPWFDESFILGGISESSRFGAVSLADESQWRSQGPLAGLLAGLKRSPHSWLALVAVDHPSFGCEVLETLLSYARNPFDMVIPQDAKKRPQWLCGLYCQSLIGLIETNLADGQRAVKTLALSCRVKLVPWHPHWPLQTFRNLNTPQDAHDAGYRII